MHQYQSRKGWGIRQNNCRSQYWFSIYIDNSIHRSGRESSSDHFTRVTINVGVTLLTPSVLIFVRLYSSSKSVPFSFLAPCYRVFISSHSVTPESRRSMISFGDDDSFDTSFDSSKSESKCIRIFRILLSKRIKNSRDANISFQT